MRKQKPIERTFYTVKSQFSKSFSGFCGGTILERRKSLKRRIKNKAIPQDYEVRSHLETWIDGEYNLQEYGGSEAKYRGMEPSGYLERGDPVDPQGGGRRAESHADAIHQNPEDQAKRRVHHLCREKIWYMNPGGNHSASGRGGLCAV